MEFPPINSARVNNVENAGEFSPPIISPTTRSPIGISPRNMAKMFSSFEKIDDNTRYGNSE